MTQIFLTQKFVIKFFFCHFDFPMNANCNDDKVRTAQQQFESILATFSDAEVEQQQQFLGWLRRRIWHKNMQPMLSSTPTTTTTTTTRDNKRHNLVRKQLGRIAKRLRELTPLEYCLDFPPATTDGNGVQLEQHQGCSSPAPISQPPAPPPPAATITTTTGHQQRQQLVWPVAGAFADCTPHNTIHVDAFLFDDDDVDQLVTDGIVRRSFCTKCRSTEVEQFNLISHSLTIDELHHLFTVRLPSLDGKVLVDIGSRLGAVLYAAALYCPRIGRVIGIEREPFFHELQCQIVAEFGLCPPVELRCADVRSVGGTLDGADNPLASADVVIMNNVFTFFADHADQVSCWQHLHAHLRVGTLLVHSPALELVTAHLCAASLGFSFTDWLQTLHIGTAAKSAVVSVDTDTFSIYRIV